MKVAVYVGAAPGRDAVLASARALLPAIAHEVVLVRGSYPASPSTAATQHALGLPPTVRVQHASANGDALRAIQQAEREYGAPDMLVIGRWSPPLGGLLPALHRRIVQHTTARSVLFVPGAVGVLAPVLLASSGSPLTFAAARLLPQVVPPPASVTVLHVLSQQQLLFEIVPDLATAAESFLASDLPDVRVLRQTVRLLQQQGYTADLSITLGPTLDEIGQATRQQAGGVLVIGASPPLSALERVLLEDVSGTLLDSSPLPVLAVRAGDTTPPEPLTVPDELIGL